MRLEPRCLEEESNSGPRLTVHCLHVLDVLDVENKTTKLRDVPCVSLPRPRECAGHVARKGQDSHLNTLVQYTSLSV